jgi:hypothetical protein
MAKRRRGILVPEATSALNQLKVRVMEKEGYTSKDPDQLKYEVAKGVNVPLNKDYNGTLTSHQAGKVGGQIGGKMVRELVKIAQQNLNKP